MGILRVGFWIFAETLNTSSRLHSSTVSTDDIGVAQGVFSPRLPTSGNDLAGNSGGTSLKKIRVGGSPRQVSRLYCFASSVSSFLFWCLLFWSFCFYFGTHSTGELPARLDASRLHAPPRRHTVTHSSPLLRHLLPAIWAVLDPRAFGPRALELRNTNPSSSVAKQPLLEDRGRPGREECKSTSIIYLAYHPGQWLHHRG